MRIDRLKAALVLVVCSLVAAASGPDGDGPGRYNEKVDRETPPLRAADSASARNVHADSDPDEPAVEIPSTEGIAAAGPDLTCDKAGSFDSRHLHSNRYRGNVYRIEFDDVVLREIRVELAFDGEANLWFSIHRAPSSDAAQSFKRVAPDCELTGAQGNGLNNPPVFHSCTLSPPLALERGYDYAIGVSWGLTSGTDRRVRYGNNTSPHPKPFLHGQVLKRLLIDNVSPPVDDVLDNFLSSSNGVYSIELCFEPVAGACCSSALPGSGCLEVLRTACLDAGSFFHGDRSDCREAACSFGACCLPCGECLADYTREACEAEGGNWAGAGVPCPSPPNDSTDLCPVITGACCNGASCSEVCVDECERQDGEYQDDGTTCFPNICAGACCVTNRGCDDLTQTACEALPGSDFKGEGTTCIDPPEGNECGGACCVTFLGDRLCVPVDARDECVPEQGFEDPCYLGDALSNGFACTSSAVCDPPPECGACCLPDASCLVGTLDFCDQAGGFFTGEDTCDAVMCTTACCIDVPDEGTECRMTRNGTDCTDMGGTIAAVDADSCVPNPCSVSLGGCCSNVAMGDYDADADVDLVDHTVFVDCLAGPGVIPDPLSVMPGECLATFDFDTDADVDLENFAVFQIEFGQEAVACREGVTRADCAESGGRFEAGGCGDCPTASLGACCRPNGRCVELVSETECVNVFGSSPGQWHRGASCIEVQETCDLRGACCAETGACLFILESECTAIGGIFTQVGEECAEDTCPAGGCCIPLSGGVCELRRSDVCPDENDPPGTVYLGDGTACDAGVCAIGACCDEAQDCVEVFASQCVDPASEFSPGVACDPDVCLPGACCAGGSCSFDSRAACQVGDGVYQGAGTPCDPALCTLGSCCERDGSCTDDVVQSQCDDSNGIEFRAGINCQSPVPCEQPGACCLRNGTCLDDQLTSQCEDASGVFTPGGVCGLIDCVAIGACCDNETCTDETQADCDTSGGVYQGDGSECTLGLCTLGSCCSLDGSTCTDDLVASECGPEVGLFRPGVTCAEGPSCDARGACCLRDGDCVDDVLPQTCLSNGGVLTPDAQCASITCEALGACCNGGQCTEGTRTACENGGGIYQGDDTFCGAGTCPVAACCNDGECTETSEVSCVSAGGVYLSDEPVCTGSLCLLGACCHLDGSCDDNVLSSECTDPFDIFSELDTCDLSCLVPRGACCLPDSTCRDATPRLLCENQGGTYDGDGTVCRPDLCATGACCLMDEAGSCNDVSFTRQTCEMNGGVFQGAGSTCTADLCTLGSCCTTDATCTDNAVASQCVEPDVFTPQQTCGQVECAGRGACCVPGEGCRILTAAECGGLLGSYGGDATTCSPGDLCDEGACCRFDDTCVQQIRMLCERQGGVYQGAGVDCVEADCARGACCKTDGNCSDDMPASSCTAEGDVFESGADCADITCEPRGACCVGGSCTIETRASCLVAGGTYQGPAVLCVPGLCPISIIGSDPGHCSIDARQPTDPDGGTVYGWNSVTITFDGDASALVIPDDLTVEVIPEPAEVPAIADISTDGNDATLALDPPIPPGHWTCITHNESGARTCLGFLPADVDGDGTGSTADIARLIDCIDGTVSCELWQCDLDQSGECTAADIARGIDLLNGAEAFDSWLGRSLDTCPSSAP